MDQSDRWFGQTLSADLADLGTVIGYVASEGAPWIGLVGHSRGGGLAILGAAVDERVRALVTWAAVAGFQRYSPDELERWRRDGRIEVINGRTGQVLPIGPRLLADLEANGSGPLDVRAAAARIRVPWLIVHGTADESVSPEEAGALAEVSGAPRTEVFRVEGGTHTFGAAHPWRGSAPALDAVLERTVRFLGAALG